jgi:hypothetical protein
MESNGLLLVCRTNQKTIHRLPDKLKSPVFDFLPYQSMYFSADSKIGTKKLIRKEIKEEEKKINQK